MPGKRNGKYNVASTTDFLPATQIFNLDENAGFQVVYRCCNSLSDHDMYDHTGFFIGNGGMFRVAPPLELKKLEAIFRHKVLRMLLAGGKITQEMITMLSTWRHSGFNVFCGNRISPKQERMQYLDQEGKVIYMAKDGKKTKIFPALEWLARARPPPKIHDPPVCIHGAGRSAAPSISDDVSQIPVHDDNTYGDPQYSWDDYIEA